MAGLQQPSARLLKCRQGKRVDDDPARQRLQTAGDWQSSGFREWRGGVVIKRLQPTQGILKLDPKAGGDVRFGFGDDRVLALDAS